MGNPSFFVFFVDMQAELISASLSCCQKSSRLLSAWTGGGSSSPAVYEVIREVILCFPPGLGSLVEVLQVLASFFRLMR